MPARAEAHEAEPPHAFLAEAARLVPQGEALACWAHDATSLIEMAADIASSSVQPEPQFASFW